jgi:hypothetical protein
VLSLLKRYTNLLTLPVRVAAEDPWGLLPAEAERAAWEHLCWSSSARLFKAQTERALRVVKRELRDLADLIATLE